jgi:hypothetical protein
MFRERTVKLSYPAGTFPFFASIDFTRPSASLYGTESLEVFGTWRMPLSVPLMGDVNITSMRSGRDDAVWIREKVRFFQSRTKTTVFEDII